MKALSVREPWASMIALGYKPVENRNWRGCRHRGPLALHASSGIGSYSEFLYACQCVREALGSDERWKAFEAKYLTQRTVGGWRVYAPGPAMRLGGLIAVVRVVGEVFGDDDGNGTTLEPAPVGATERRLTKAEQIWHSGGFGLLLADAEPVDFIPWKGARGFFDIPDGVVQRAREMRAAQLALDAKPAAAVAVAGR